MVVMQVKGSVLRARKEFVIDHFGEQGWQTVLAALQDEDRDFWQDVIITSDWYDFVIGERLDKTIVSVLGKGNERVFEQIGAKSAKRNLTGVHRSFLSPGNPQSFMHMANTIYKFYYDTGYREYEETGATSGVMTTFEAETFSIPDCLTVIGWYREALQMCGAKNIKIFEDICRARGGAFCRYHFNWEI
jgi:hypothetical protein